MSDLILLKALERVDRALLAEIAVLREGRFEELRELQRETAEAMQGLDHMRTQGGLAINDRNRIERALANLAERAERARGLLAYALNGARNARTRIEALVGSEGQIGAYDRTGTPLSVKGAPSPYNRTF